MKRWYEIQNLAGAGAAELRIYDSVGGFGIPAQVLVDDIAALEGRPLNVRINSPGGIASDGVAIYNALRRHGNADVTVDGMALSAASVIAQGGRARRMATGSVMMIHDPVLAAVGPAAEMEKARGVLEVIAGELATIYAERAGGDPADWREAMIAESWYGAADAVEAGLADEVSSLDPATALGPRVFNLAEFRHVPEWVRERQASLNREVPPKEKSEMENVYKILGLAADAGEDAVTAAIQSIQTQAAADAATIRDLRAASPDTAELVTLRGEIVEAEKRFLSREADLQKQILELGERSKRAEATALVETAMSQGRITPANKEIAIKLALRDPDEFEQFVKALPGVDYSERGVAYGDDLAGLEPTAADVKIAKQLGTWDDSNPAKSRRAIMEQKARDKGLELPSEE